MTSIQRCINVDAKSSGRCVDVNATLYKRHVYPLDYFTVFAPSTTLLIYGTHKEMFAVRRNQLKNIFTAEVSVGKSRV